MEVGETTASTLENQDILQRANDIESLVFRKDNMGLACLTGVANEGMAVGLSLNLHASPGSDGDIEGSSMDVLVFIDKVLGKFSGENLGNTDIVVLGKHIDGILLGVGGDDDGVIGLGVRFF